MLTSPERRSAVLNLYRVLACQIPGPEETLCSMQHISATNSSQLIMHWQVQVLSFAQTALNMPQAYCTNMCYVQSDQWCYVPFIFFMHVVLESMTL